VTRSAVHKAIHGIRIAVCGRRGLHKHDLRLDRVIVRLSACPRNGMRYAMQICFHRVKRNGERERNCESGGWEMMSSRYRSVL
jgi:hypothetical protein